MSLSAPQKLHLPAGLLHRTN